MYHVDVQYDVIKVILVEFDILYIFIIVKYALILIFFCLRF